jgi:hypothetical protein
VLKSYSFQKKKFLLPLKKCATGKVNMGLKKLPTIEMVVETG